MPAVIWIEQVQRDFLKHKRFVFAIDPDVSRVVTMRTTDKYEAIAAVGTNGDNYDVSNKDVIAWLRKLEKEEPFTLSGIGGDFLRGTFKRKVKNAKALARRMYAFCPDIVDQGVEFVENLAQLLRES